MLKGAHGRGILSERVLWHLDLFALGTPALFSLFYVTLEKEIGFLYLRRFQNYRENETKSVH